MTTTGANNTPLGKMNPLLLAAAAAKRTGGSSLLNPSYLQAAGTTESSSPVSQKRDLDQEIKDFSGLNDRKRKRKSRWGGDEKEKSFIPGMPTVLPSNLQRDQEEAYLLQLQIEEISRKLRTGDLGIPPNPEDRSPSPEPIYSSDGKRLNTREYRTRKKLEEERHQCIIRMQCINHEYKPPADYKPPIVRVSDKVMIPQEEHPDINFVGLLIGPRGNTLKSIEKETGTKIIIRGKGSVKEGKVGRKDGQPLPGEDEPLHAYITAHNPEFVKKAVEKLKEIIRQGVEVPEGQNDLRRMQLRELALLNGTLRENDGPRCSNCGATTHKSWQCQDKPNVTNNVLCTNCGGAGHIARDCRQKRPGAGGPVPGVERNKIDEEYMSLMAELGEGPPPPKDMDPAGRGFRRSVGPSIFDARPGPPRPIMAAPGPRGMHPPGMQALQWPTQPPPPGSKDSSPPYTSPPPPPPPPGVQQNMMQQWQSYAAVPMQGPPPPPPPGTTTPANNWQSAPPPPPSQTQMHWQQPQASNPGPVPPPQRHHPPPPGMYPWQQAYMGVPPPMPPPPPPPGSQTNSNVDLNMLAHSALPSLLVAPPPPPPSEGST